MSTVREIEFEYNQLKVCYSGQLLNGRANIFFSVDTHIKGKFAFALCFLPLCSNICFQQFTLRSLVKGLLGGRNLAEIEIQSISPVQRHI